MDMLPFADYRPDVNDLDGAHTRNVRNVVPRADGYGPFKRPVSFAAAFPAPCRGYFYARKTDGSVAIFAGTATKLYLLDNTTLTWTDVSKTGGYTGLSPQAQWQFAQFGNFVIAVQANADPQVYDLGASTEFDDLGGSPPRAAFISIVNRFVVLSGLPSFPRRVHWSGLNDIEEWTPGTKSSDAQDLPDGGNALRVLGGEFGIILQESAIRRMIFSPGSETIFDIQRISEDLGCFAPYSACQGDRGFFLSQKGFYQVSGAGELLPIGEEQVNRTFFADYDEGAVQLVIGAVDPAANTVLFTYKSNNNTNDTFDRVLVYNYVLRRWAPLRIEGEYLAPLAAPGLTLEALDEIAPGAVAVSGAADSGSGEIRLTVTSTAGWTTGDWKTISGVTGTTEANGTWQITVVDGTHIDLNGSIFTNAYVSGGIAGGSLDALPFPLDTVGTSTVPNLSMIDAEHKLAFFAGDNMDAVLETAEQSGNGRRFKVKGFWPITDAAVVKGRISKRENLHETRTYTTESTMDARGFVPQLRDTRYARGSIRIPEGTAWTYASGIRPDFVLTGRQ